MALRFLPAWFCILCLLGNAWSMAPEYEAGMHAKLLTICYKHPKYQVGGKLKNGKIDCSELLREAAERAGIPGMKTRRYRACDIYQGVGPWKNRVVTRWEIGDNRKCDLLFQHIPNGLDRPGGVNHVLAVVIWNGVFHIVHASSSKGTVVIRPIAPWVTEHLVTDGYRRLTIGDK